MLITALQEHNVLENRMLIYNGYLLNVLADVIIKGFVQEKSNTKENIHLVNESAYLGGRTEMDIYFLVCVHVIIRCKSQSGAYGHK